MSENIKIKIEYHSMITIWYSEITEYELPEDLLYALSANLQRMSSLLISLTISTLLHEVSPPAIEMDLGFIPSVFAKILITERFAFPFSDGA